MVIHTFTSKLHVAGNDKYSNCLQNDTRDRIGSQKAGGSASSSGQVCAMQEDMETTSLCFGKLGKHLARGCMYTRMYRYICMHIHVFACMYASKYVSSFTMPF